LFTRKEFLEASTIISTETSWKTTGKSTAVTFLEKSGLLYLKQKLKMKNIILKNMQFNINTVVMIA
jgi:hypothetical protein